MSFRPTRPSNSSNKLPAIASPRTSLMLSTTVEATNPDKESSPTTKGGRKTYNSKNYYMGNLTTNLVTESSNALTSYDESTRMRSGQHSRQPTQDMKLGGHHGSDPGMKSFWSQNPYLDFDSVHAKMMISVSPQATVDPDDSLIEEVEKPIWTQTHRYLDKFTNSIYLLNSLDKRKLPLSKNIFISNSQRDMITKFNSKGPIMTEGGHIKTIKENRREVIELNSFKTTYCKIDTSFKTFPLVFRGTISSGSYEIYVSKSLQYPNRDFHDYSFTTDTFEIDYDNVPIVYFSITALQYLRVSFVMSFKSEKSEKMRKDKELARNQSNLYKSTKLKPLTQEQLIDLQFMAKEIKQEKRQKILKLSNNKDIVKLNKSVAAEYRSYKQLQIETLVNKIHFDYPSPSLTTIISKKSLKIASTLKPRKKQTKFTRPSDGPL